MRIDPRPTLPELLPAFLAYGGPALRPFLTAPHVTESVLADCAALAVEYCDSEGLRLARSLRRLSGDQRRDLKKSLTAPKSLR